MSCLRVKYESIYVKKKNRNYIRSLFYCPGLCVVTKELKKLIWT